MPMTNQQSVWLSRLFGASTEKPPEVPLQAQAGPDRTQQEGQHGLEIREITSRTGLSLDPDTVQLDTRARDAIAAAVKAATEPGTQCLPPPAPVCVDDPTSYFSD